MPTVLRRGDLVVKVYGPPREHPPPHVHVHVGAEGLVVIRLGRAGEPPKVWRVYEASDQHVLRAYRLVEAEAAYLRAKWEEIHGE
jgi:hypothetical protein